MLPLHQANEVRDSLKAYLRATFDFLDAGLRKAFETFVDHPDDGLFKGPYISVKLPFVKADDQAMEGVGLEVKPVWPPYQHQTSSWRRLSTRHQVPQPTLVTTGTGSGKTESFLYPVLDYCLTQQARRGIKCIILYPMNALATDQAKRLAEVIHEDARLRGKITAGLFIGDSSDASLPSMMGEDHVVELRDAIVADPPDILLTNFKMLDYGLMQARFHPLWEGNFADASLLKFLVLDEMHTYDGAQGTDVANLIRRLKLKLDIPTGQLCPVGTSATLGTGEDAARDLALYASTLFGEEVGVDAVIGETRVSLDEFFGDETALDEFLPRPSYLAMNVLQRDADYDEYIEQLATMWQLDPSDLASGLRGLRIVRDLVACCAEEPGIHRLDELVTALERRNPVLRQSARKNHSVADQFLLVESLIALIGAAREGELGLPMLFVQVQMWIRELSGLRRRLDARPSFHWREEQVELGEAKHMPPWYCRECGTSGWLVAKPDHKQALDPASGDGTNKFFSNDKNTHFLIASSRLSRAEAAAGGYDTRDSFEAWLDPATLELHDKDGEGRMRVFGARRLDAKGFNDHVCPSCNTRNNLSIIGSRVATLGSITVSQALASDFDESSERERKVLAFTNSVQDAAHQAGFMEARNYRFTMRASIQRVIKQTGAPLTLPALQEAFRNHWEVASDDQGKGDIAAYYNRFFPKDYIGRSEPDDYKQDGKFLPIFEEAFRERMEWEVLNEFGFESQLGRTLEKTGCAGMWWDASLIEATAAGMEGWLEEHEKPGQIARESLPAFIALIAHRLRTRGAVDHPLLKRFRESGNFDRSDLNWYNSPKHILHRWFAARTRLPRMVIHVPHSQGLADTTHSSRPVTAGSPNWFHAYFHKTFQLANQRPQFISEFYEQLFAVGTEVGLFHRVGQGREANDALQPKAIWVAEGVEEFACTSCGHTVFEGRGENKVDLHEGLCLNYRCKGRYARVTAEREPNYYQLVYNRSRSPRVIAREHTGLLERKVRERLEVDFKKREKFNAPNALVATSTLEMGIDIGSLQIAINTSVPPTPSNFLQRVGRAGRKSGTALIVNFATRRSHDQYYFADPAEMMVGEVAAPGCYLEAREILRRHYFAYCIDSWTKANPRECYIPSLVRGLKLLQEDVMGQGFFMNRVLAYADANEEILLSRFLDIYRSRVSAATLENLMEWVRSPQFSAFHQQVFVRLKSELQGLQAEKAAIARRIQDERLQPEDDLHQELMREQKSLGGMIMNINKRQVLEHLTNVGVLPNYAFPETGVTLNARVFKQTGMQSVRSPLNKEYVIVRSATQALRELVPGSAFYSQGYRLEIGGLSVHDLAAEGERHMRFCSACDHVEESTTSIEHVPCPKCGDESWMANSNRHRVAHLTNVRSSTSSSRSRLVDRHETRQADPFHVSRHFKFKRSTGAYAIPSASFGIEFVREAEVTEFNLGFEGGAQANVMEINGTKYPRHGFITCKSCGKSTAKPLREARDYHYSYCPHVGEAWSDAQNAHFHELYLFRRVTTEALKVLVPVQEVDTSGPGLDLFQAGLELGFKKYFKGNPQHLLLRPYQEFNRSSGRMDLYLVILDAVPGGTGYLEKLFEPEEFGQVLRLAHDAMVECACQLAGKDGCYRCVYSYGNQRVQDDLSRAAGVEMFRNIVDRLDGWERMVDGLDSLAQTGRLEESELERKFISALRKYARQSHDFTFAEENEDGEVHYSAQTHDSLTYHIQPQVELGTRQGYRRPTRPDFLITATRYLVDGVDQRDRLPQIAVYLDGFQYHASIAHARFQGDVEKREQLRLDPGFLVWTLTWDDLVRFEQGLSGEDEVAAGDFLADAAAAHPFVQHASTLASALPDDPPRTRQWRNNMERLLGLLVSPELLRGGVRGEWALSLAAFQDQLFKRHSKDVDVAFAQYLDLPSARPSERTLDLWLPLELPARQTSIAELRAVVNLAHRVVEVNWTTGSFEAPAKEDWEAFWTWYNILQFFTWRSAPLAAAHEAVPYLFPDPPPTTEGRMAAEPEVDNAWLETLLEFFPDFASEIQTLWDAGYFKTQEDEDALTEIRDERGESVLGVDFIHPFTKEVHGVTDPADVRLVEKYGYIVVK